MDLDRKILADDMKAEVPGETVDREFFHNVLDSIDDELAVIDGEGTILWTNKAWDLFGEENGVPIGTDWRGRNYLQTCLNAARRHDKLARQVFNGIREVIRHERVTYEIEYPCDSRDERRWFTLRVTSLEWNGGQGFITVHSNITQRKLAEIRAEKLAHEDALTGLANRLHFDTFIESELRRARRHEDQISLIMIDIDHFKKFNDINGHLGGDECLKRVAATIGEFCRRPSDLAARYGGEEFVVVLGAVEEKGAMALAEDIRVAIEALAIPYDPDKPGSAVVTVSAGVASTLVTPDITSRAIVEAADGALYTAKRSGRNKVLFGKLARRGEILKTAESALGSSSNSEQR